MKVKCGKCQTVLSFDETKVQQDSAIVNCPKCGQKNRVAIPKEEVVAAQVVENAAPVTTAQQSVSKRDYSKLNEHYQKVFSKFDGVIADAKNNGKLPKVSSFHSWNWAAFLLGIFWCFAKYQWKALLWILLIALISPVAYFLPLIAIWIVSGMQADLWEYYRYKTGNVMIFPTKKIMTTLVEAA